jgi:hypothetical protein
LFSARNGWFSTTPLAYAGALGVFCLPRKARLVMIGLVAVVVVQVYLASTIVDWWGSSSFGQRRLCNLTVPLAVGLAALLWRLGRLAARVPRVPPWIWRGLAAVGLAAPIWWNLWRVRDLKAGAGAPGELVAMCCDHSPKWARPALQWIYDRIGDPFEFPANAWFAWRHDVPIQRWDQAVGNYAVIPPFGAFRDDNIWQQGGSWGIAGGGAEPYLVSGWSKTFFAQRPARWTTAPTAIVLVPNLMPNPQRYTLWLAPGGASELTARWDGEIVAHGSLHPGWNMITFTLPKVGVGEHELALESEPAALPPGGWPDPGMPVGVAASTVDIQLIPP